ncbi:MAG: DNA/RNA nuclease SfsA [Clostridia bacterium]|nr:DNA/RNA nuclease SfsA [Clostridia bacterium]
MTYSKIKKATFISRPNRFVAYVNIDGEETACHVKNTGRCRELLVPGAEVYLEVSDNPARKYKHSLVAVRKGERLVNMDSQAPNKMVGEWLEGSGMFQNIRLLKAESTYKKSRFDFYCEYEDKKAFIEVKGVTLENYGVVSFPDAPTERGTKHINELMECMGEGYEAYIIFVVQMKDVLYFTPNEDHDPAFAKALRKAAKCGVNIIAVDSDINESSAVIKDRVEVRL